MVRWYMLSFTTKADSLVPKVTAPNIYRTVMIDFIPIGAKYSDILAHIRGGALESIQLYGPVGSATNFVTARVVFTHELGATTLYQVSFTKAKEITSIDEF